MTTAQLADLIIIGCFFGVLASAVGHIIGKGICWIIDKIKAMRGKDKTNGNEVEQ